MWLIKEMGCSIDGILQGLSEGRLVTQFILYKRISLCFSLLDARRSHPVSDRRGWIDANEDAPATKRAASFFFQLFFSCWVHLSQTTLTYIHEVAL